MSNEKQDNYNEVTNRCNNFRIKDTSQDPDIWFNELFNLNLKFKNIKAKYNKDEYEMKSHVFDGLPEYYKPVRVSCNFNISKMAFKDLNKDIRWFWKTELNRHKTK